MSDYLTSEDLAALLRYDSMESLYTARRRGNLPPAIRRGNRLLWSRKTVERWMDAHEEQPA